MAKVFVCDDDAGILDMMSLMMEVLGHDVVTEGDSLQVYKKVKDVKPDLVVVDLWMPYLPGSELIKILKADQGLANIPVIAFSASTEGKKIALEAGADDFMGKPFTIETIAKKMEKYIGRATA